jgi:hypothetical protein
MIIETGVIRATRGMRRADAGWSLRGGEVLVKELRDYRPMMFDNSRVNHEIPAKLPSQTVWKALSD